VASDAAGNDEVVAALTVPDRPLVLGRAGGGNVVPIGGRNPAARGLARAAQALDTAACSSLISQAIAAHGVIEAWDHLVVPVLTGIGRHWSATGQGVEVEHALSAAVQDALSVSIRASRVPVGGRAVVLAGAPGEVHSLPLWAVGAALAERGIAARILGASLPVDSLIQAVQRLGPAAVFVWAQLEQSADRAILSAVPALRPAVAVLVGGPGWPADLPPGVTRVTDLGDAVTQIGHALGD
jgi:methanogenic corrinoid protein MtbC1